MADPNTPDTLASLNKALSDQPNPNLDDQGDIAADDAGATALAVRVTKDAGVQGEEQPET